MTSDLETDFESTLVPNASQVLLIKIGEALACIELAYVVRTISLVNIQSMPGSASYVAGIMNYAGISLPVIDLAIRLGLQSLPYTLDTPIMVCEYDGRRIAVIVEDIVGIQFLKNQDRQLASELSGCREAFLASAHTDLGLALLLNVSWLTNSSLYPPGHEQVIQVEEA